MRANYEIQKFKAMADLKLWDVYVQTERERDEARARLEVADRANDVLKAQLAEAERLRRETADEIERLRAEVARLTLDGIHSCHDDCPRLPCVQRREIERLTAERDWLQDANVREWREIKRLHAALERIAEGHEYDPGHYRYEHDELAKIARAALAGTIGDTNADTGANRAPEPADVARCEFPRCDCDTNERVCRLPGSPQATKPASEGRFKRGDRVIREGGTTVWTIKDVVDHGSAWGPRYYMTAPRIGKSGAYGRELRLAVQPPVALSTNEENQ